MNRSLPGICAHRGLSGAMPENTLPAFAAAIAAGAQEIEFDLFPSADGIPVVSHDPDLARVAGVPMPPDNAIFSRTAASFDQFAAPANASSCATRGRRSSTRSLPGGAERIWL